MGFIDALDNALTSARARNTASREAARFERACKAGVPYYSLEECQQPWGNEPRAREWVFTCSRLGGLTCGPHSPAYVWLNYGPLIENPGHHITALMDPGKGGHAPSEKDQHNALKAALAALAKTRKELSKH